MDGTKAIYLLLYRNGTQREDMIIISSREFRQNQRLYFDKVDQGEQIIVQRGKDKSYVLTPVTEDDMYFNAAMIKRIKDSLNQAAHGDFKTVASDQELSELLGL